MRIAVIGPTYPYKGGGAAHTTELAHRLRAAGHDVVIESWRAQYPSFLYPGRQTVDTPDGEPFPNVLRDLDWRRPDGWVRAGRRLRSADLVVLVVLSPVQVPPYLGILYGLGRRTRVVALCHNVLPHERKPYDTPLMKALLRRVDTVLVHSEGQAGKARELAATPVRVAEMAPHLPSGADRHGGHGPAEGVHDRLLFFGLVRPYKGLDLLIRALPDGVSLRVAGEFWGGLEETTRALAAELRLDGRVELRPGYVASADLPGLFADVDALVLPYRSGTASQQVWLGHEHGVPVIASRVGTLGDHVTDGVDGLLVEPGSVEGLRAALTAFYRPGEPERLRAGVKAVDPEPYWASYVEALVSDAAPDAVSEAAPTPGPEAGPDPSPDAVPAPEPDPEPGPVSEAGPGSSR
ncbi:glycosyltransferase [Streptosporangium sp. NPDC000509]|uniref:glycosyltransferase family 4 protein n=1 Tax=Streptosporangium sp. NPDC000509 TaxID=3366186 RepID=UPI0036C1B8AB